MTALNIQQEFAGRCAEFCEDRFGRDLDQPTHDVLGKWIDILDRLAHDPSDCAKELDWVAKLQILEGYRRRDVRSWDDAVLQLVDLQYSDVSPEKGLARKLETRGSLLRLTDPAAVDAAVTDPPIDTRAWFRGECLRRYSADIAAASWDSIVFDVPTRQSLQRVPTLDPLKGTKEHVEELLDASPTAEHLLRALTGH
jgi:proteasome accessory factor A